MRNPHAILTIVAFLFIVALILTEVRINEVRTAIDYVRSLNHTKKAEMIVIASLLILSLILSVSKWGRRGVSREYVWEGVH